MKLHSNGFGLGLAALLLSSCPEAGRPVDWPGESPLRFALVLDEFGAVHAVEGPLVDGTALVIARHPGTQLVVVSVDVDAVRLRSARVDLAHPEQMQIAARTPALDGCEVEGNIADDELELPLDDDPGSGIVELFTLDPGEMEFREAPPGTVALDTLSLHVPLLERCDPGFRLDVQPYGAASPYFDLSSPSVTVDGSPLPIGVGGLEAFRDARPLGSDRILLLTPLAMLTIDRGRAWLDAPGRAREFAEEAGASRGLPEGDQLVADAFEYWPARSEGMMALTGLRMVGGKRGKSVAWASFSTEREQLTLGDIEVATPLDASLPEYSFVDIAGAPGGEYVTAGLGRIQTATSASARPEFFETKYEVDEVRWVEGYDRSYILTGDMGVEAGHPRGGPGALRSLGDRPEIGRIHAVSAEMVDGDLEILAGSTGGEVRRYRKGEWSEIALDLPPESASCTEMICGRRRPSTNLLTLVVIPGPDGRKRLISVYESCAAVFAIDTEGDCATATPFAMSGGDPALPKIEGLELLPDELVSLGDTALLVGRPALLEEIRVLTD